MRKKYFLILSLILISTTLVAQEEDQVELDLKENRIKSQKGLDIKYENNIFRVFDVKKDNKNQKMYIKDKFILDSYNLSGDIRIEGTDGEIGLNGKVGNLGKTYGYLEVGTVTGAEKPNDKIYFGGDKTEYSREKISLIDTWITTDPKVEKVKDFKGLGYSLNADEVIIEPDKQITLKDIDVYVKDKNIMPFKFPWYRLNIRKDSEVPLFPEWGSDDDYGWYISQGTLYESKDKKFEGGFSPKFADQMGFLIGRMENWYKFDKFGESRLNITDALILKKEKDNKKDKFGREDESYNDRWNIDYTHKYNGEYGNFDFGISSLTYNLNPALKDAVDDLGKNKKPDMGNHSNFYTLNTSLKGIGDKKDIAIDARLKLTDDKKGYSYIVNDKIDDMSYGSQIDHDLFSDISITKDNEKYKINGYYNYLYDMDKGSNINDDKSRAENFGFIFNDKENKVLLKYDEKNEDEHRKLDIWERNPNLSSILVKNKYGLKADYTPWTISKYNKNDSKKLGVEFGEYGLTGGTSFKVGYTYDFTEKELNLDNDPLRKDVFSTDNRLSQYNRFENTIYEKKEEERAFVKFFNDMLDFEVAGGIYEENIISREGQNLGSKNYINKSNFYEVGISKDEISMNEFGTLNIFGNIRKDEYKEGSDDTIRFRTGLTHKLEMGDSLENEFGLFYQDYSYSGDEKRENQRTINKEKEIKYSDEIKFSLGDYNTVYTGEYETKNKVLNNEKSGEIFKNKIDFLKENQKLLSVYFNNNKRYIDDNELNKNYNDLTKEDYGVNLFIGNNEFYYKNKNIDNFIFKNKDFGLNGNFNETISSNTFGYVSKFNDNRLNLEYSEGKDKANIGNKDVLDINNKIYSLSLTKGNEIEHFYGISYEDYIGNYKKHTEDKYQTKYNSDVISLRYTFKDKRVSDDRLRSYASKEFMKDKKDITSDEIMKIKEVIEKRGNTSFDLSKTIDSRINYTGDYKRSFALNLSMERSKDRYRETSDYLDSLKEFKIGTFYSQNRVGFGYTYSEEADYTGGVWKTTEKEHELSFHAKIGKPSEGWRTKTYVQFYDGTEKSDSYIDEFGLEVGKEMGYYEWSVAYIREYSLATKDYEWKTALQFTLLTFPDKTIFSLGGKGGSDKDTRPAPHLFSGIKINDMK